MKASLIFLLFSLLTSSLIAQESGRLVLQVDGIPNNDGKVRAALFDSPEGFPEELNRGQQRGASAVVDGQSTIIFSDVPFGSYVLAVFHDENNNGELDKNDKGIPLEALGVSNNVKMKLGPPKFERAVFEINELETEVAISLQQYKAATRTEN
jgi:uncharacterized protein (DUF2141 family)